MMIDKNSIFKFDNIWLLTLVGKVQYLSWGCYVIFIGQSTIWFALKEPIIIITPIEYMYQCYENVLLFPKCFNFYHSYTPCNANLIRCFTISCSCYSLYHVLPILTLGSHLKLATRTRNGQAPTCKTSDMIWNIMGL